MSSSHFARRELNSIALGRERHLRKRDAVLRVPLRSRFMAKSTQSLQADPIYDQLAKLILMWRWRGKLGRTEASPNGLAEMVRQELRTRLIHDICAPSLRPLAIVRREQVAKPGLRRVLTSRQRLNASAWSRSSCARRRKAPTGSQSLLARQVSRLRSSPPSWT